MAKRIIQALAVERFLDKINISNKNFYNDIPCWEWTASLTKGGYGQFRHNGKTLYAHRISYEIHMSTIPTNLQIDHLCRNRTCVNPDHLEAVTLKENIQRGLGGLNNLIKTHCPQNHEYTKENTYIDSKGKRHCKICIKTQSKNWALNNPDKIKESRRKYRLEKQKERNRMQ